LRAEDYFQKATMLSSYTVYVVYYIYEAERRKRRRRRILGGNQNFTLFENLIPYKDTK
jgi:hypothetical protein